MKKNFAFWMLFCALSFTLISCEELLNEEKEDEKTEIPGTGGSEIPDNPNPSTLTPGEHQQKLERIAQQFVGYFNPAEQQVMVDALYNLTEYLSYSEFNEGDFVTIEASMEESQTRNVCSLMQKSGLLQTLNSAANVEVGALTTMATRAVEPEYLFTLDDYQGYEFIWNPSTEEWIQNEISGDRVRAAWDNAEVVISWINSTKSYAIELDGELYQVYIPTRLSLTFKVGNQEQLYIEVQPNYESEYVIRPAATMRLAGGFVATVNAAATRTEVTATTTFSKGDLRLAVATAEVAINDLTDTDNWLEEEREEWYGEEYVWTDCFIDEYIYEQVKSGAFRVDILEATLCGIGDARKVIDGLEQINDEESEQGCKQLCNLINQNLTLYMLYNDSQEKVADVKAQPVKDSWYDSWYGVEYEEYYAEPVLIFGDGSKFAIESFFTENKFSDLIDSVVDLAERYEELID